MQHHVCKLAAAAGRALFKREYFRGAKLMSGPFLNGDAILSVEVRIFGKIKVTNS